MTATAAQSTQVPVAQAAANPAGTGKAVAGDPITLKAHDGYALATYRYPASGPARASVVFGAAMAVPEAFYAAFAGYLARQGYDVWTFDYRGTGESLKGSMRGFKADLSDWLRLDYDAVVQAAAAARADKPLYLLGHSLGGQIAPLLPSRARVAGLVNIAVGSGSLRHNVPSLRRKAPLMWYVMAPLLCPLFGYFPGSKIGVIGDLPTGAMMQWRKWCLTPDYLLSGEPGARAAYASADYPVLALTFADDELLLEEGSRMLHDAYQKRRADFRLIRAADYGLARIGHCGFFKPQCEAQVWPLVTEWLDGQLSHQLSQQPSQPDTRKAA